MHLLRLNDQGGFTLASAGDTDGTPHGILSHTWGSQEDEVTFEEIKRGFGKEKAGYAKITFCAERAKENDLKHFWIDSCCIHRPNNTELAEAINSMFRWYKAAAKCFVHLQDVSTLKRGSDGMPCHWEAEFRKSRWFRRGWTLQELLAPKTVEFWARDGKFLGTKETLKDLIHQITDIPLNALCGVPLSSFSTNERLRWAAGRETTKREDRAYCLLGVFGVFLPPIYGEGDHAYLRLMDEVSKLSNLRRDETIHVQQQKITKYPGDPSASLKDVAQHRGDLLAFLQFEQIDARHDNIKNAQRATCEWLLQHPAYVAWIDRGASSTPRGILWIAGKPGAGKSTLMKFALAHAMKGKLEKEIIISFFFNARGDELEKTTLGMYRAILYQLLREAPDLRCILDTISRPHRDGQSIVWDIQKLQDLLSIAVGKLGGRSLKIFVDALDECDAEQVRGMVNFLEDLGDVESSDGSRLRVCFASRHYPAIEIDYGWRLVLEDEVGHANDPGRYIERHFRAGKGKLANDVRLQVQEKANGVFLWVVLVVDILRDEFSSGRIFNVKKRLQEIPGGVSDTCKEIICKDSKDMDELLLCLQWILFAKRPLTREEFYFAMEAGLECKCNTDTEWKPTSWDPEEVSPESMAQLTQSSSKGLAEITKSKKTPTVQFIHESVKDFLARDGGLREVWPEFDDGMISSSHEKLKVCCEAYLAADISSRLHPTRSLPTASSDDAKVQQKMISDRYPFMQYAIQNILFHANEAALYVPQDSFLNNLPLEKWVHVANACERYLIRRYSPGVSLLYILAENGYTRLVEASPKLDVWVRLPRERYQFPALAAFANGYKDTMKGLLGPSGAGSLDNIAKDPGFGKPSQVRDKDDILLWAMKHQNLVLAEFLATTCADQGLFSLSAGSRREQDPLLFAAHQGVRTVVLGLLKGGANVNAQGGYYGNALQTASHQGHSEIVKQLLEGGADANAQGANHGPALQAASSRGHGEIVKQLLEGGADANAQGGHYGNALYAASQGGHGEIVKQLLEGGADANAQGGLYGLALKAASGSGYGKILKQLLERGADVDAQSNVRRSV